MSLGTCSNHQAVPPPLASSRLATCVLASIRMFSQVSSHYRLIISAEESLVHGYRREGKEGRKNTEQNSLLCLRTFALYICTKSFQSHSAVGISKYYMSGNTAFNEKTDFYCTEFRKHRIKISYNQQANTLSCKSKTVKLIGWDNVRGSTGQGRGDGSPGKAIVQV